MLDASLVHDVVPADALRGLGGSSALIMRTGLPALGQDRAFLHRKVRTQRTLTQASGRRCLLLLSLSEEQIEVRSCCLEIDQTREHA